MSMIGKIGAFVPSSESWSSYSERLTYFFNANDVAANKKHDIFLTVCGPQTFQLLRSLAQPKDLKDVTYDELISLLSKHYDPAPSPIVQRFRFHTRERQQSETIATYVAELKNIARFCNFPADSLNEMIRDRLVCGVNDSRIQRSLLQEPKLTYEKAVEIAQGIEAASKDVQSLNPVRDHSVHQLQRAPPTTSRSDQRRTSSQSCYRCGGDHVQTACRFKNVTCRGCGKKGHIHRVCRSRPLLSTGFHRKPQEKPGKTMHSVSTVEDPPSGLPQSVPLLESPAFNEDSYHMFNTVKGSKVSPIVVTVKLNSCPVEMEIDTGASLSLINEDTLSQVAPHIQLQPVSDITLTTYTGELLPVLGTIEVEVTYNSQTACLPVVVAKGNGPNLFGRDWLLKIRLDWQNQIKVVNPVSSIELTLKKYATVFCGDLGCLKNVKARITVPPDATPRFFRPRPVTYFLRDKVNQELDRLQREGIVTPVQFSDWAAPIVPVLKADGQSVRICGDYKVTVNREAKFDSYPLPRIEDIFANLSGGQFFSKLDLTSAYQQVELDEHSKKFTTINTTRGLFQYNRLPFGIASAPSIFQRIMETLLRDIPGVSVYLDDILISGKNYQDHLLNLECVLERLQSAGVTLKREKCQFALQSVEYLGHIIDCNGLRPSPSKIAAIKDAPKPRNVSELKSFVGLLNYYNKFVSNLSVVLFPFYRLMKKGVPWTWTQVEQDAFNKAKDLLNSSSLLVHFDPSKELILAADASPFGIGGVLSHKMEDGSERPIAFTSRSLLPAEKKYAQIEKEGLAIVFAVKRFHQFLHGRSFHIYSDHKPLKYLFDEHRQIPVLASARIQRWALILSAYKYIIHHRPGEKMANADALSRLPQPLQPFDVPEPGEHKVLWQHFNETVQVMTAVQVKEWTDKDPLLSRIRHFILCGWSKSDEEDPKLRPYINRKCELSVLTGCVLWGSRVVVPCAGRNGILEELHQMHPGVIKMKSLARCFVWWPGIDSDIEKFIQRCSMCQQNKSSPPRAPIHPWEWPHRPWARIHIDHAGPFMGHLFLVVVDAHSKWMEVAIVSSTSSEVTIDALNKMFAVHGYPEQIVSDNGTGFTSTQFKEFTRAYGILHTLVSPYHPASNGMAERYVQILKQGLRMAEGPMERKLQKVLFQYRISPQTSTGLSPAELLMGRRLRNRLTLLHPDMARRAQVQRSKMDTRKTRQRFYEEGEKVFIKSFSKTSPQWIPAVVETRTGPVSYRLKTNAGVLVRRHLDHVRSQGTDAENLSKETVEEDWSYRQPSDRLVENAAPPLGGTTSGQPNTDSNSNSNVPRRSTRTRIPVNRYTPGLSC